MSDKKKEVICSCSFLLLLFVAAVTENQFPTNSKSCRCFMLTLRENMSISVSTTATEFRIQHFTYADIGAYPKSQVLKLLTCIDLFDFTIKIYCFRAS